MTKSSTPKARDTRSKSPSKAAAEKARDTHRPTEKARGKHQESTHKVVAEKAQVQHKSAPVVPAKKVVDTRRRVAAQFEEFRDTQVPDTMRALAERNVAQTREVYERSKTTLQAVLESWQKSFGATGQGAMALNRKIIDIAERNINTGFDLATSLCRAKNLAEVMELQAAYWQKQFGELRTKAEEKRVLSTKTHVGAGVPRRNQ